MNHSELSERYSALEHSLSEYESSDTEPGIEQRKQQLSSKFLKLGLVSILVFSLLSYLLAYIFMQSQEISRAGDYVHSQVCKVARIISAKKGVDRDRALDAVVALSRDRMPNLISLKLLDERGRTVKRSGSMKDLNVALDGITLTVLEPVRPVSSLLLNPDFMLALITNDYPDLVLANLVSLQNKRATVLVALDNSEGFAMQRLSSMLVLIVALLSSSIAFRWLYGVFLRSLDTIDRQELKLNRQISKLSNLLELNKSMQRSIRSASARAVELNEQFLRRTGADLHDGPAQMIGFSVMRLNMAIEKDESNLISPEFHAIKQALEESLEEIRGISSGLVLPQLESMSLEQCMNKVVLLHTSAHPTEVEEVYNNLEHEIPLPIKICAYRMVQEGLNNALRHGKAEKCRLKVGVSNGVLQIILKDDGVGFRKSQLTNDGKHLGLIGLKDRIESLGGKLGVDSKLGVGTTLRLIITLDTVN